MPENPEVPCSPSKPEYPENPENPEPPNPDPPTLAEFKKFSTVILLVLRKESGSVRSTTTIMVLASSVNDSNSGNCDIFIGILFLCRYYNRSRTFKCYS